MIAVGIVVTVVWAIQAYLAIRLENKYLVYSFYASSWLEPAAVIANLVRVSCNDGNTKNISPLIVFQVPLLQHFSKSLIYSAYAVGIIALGSRILSIYSMHLVSQNFGKGLKAKSKCATSCQSFHVLLTFSLSSQFSRSQVKAMPHRQKFKTNDNFSHSTFPKAASEHFRSTLIV